MRERMHTARKSEMMMRRSCHLLVLNIYLKMYFLIIFKTHDEQCLPAAQRKRHNLAFRAVLRKLTFFEYARSAPLPTSAVSMPGVALSLIVVHTAPLARWDVSRDARLHKQSRQREKCAYSKNTH